jgi:hypothetical protein
MPKELIHWILADRALDGLKKESRLRGLILTHRDCYLGGAVLPDTLLHLFRGPCAAQALELAARFHDTAGNSFAPLIRAEQRRPDSLPPALMACLLGVVTHMVADIVFHPFVYSQSGSNDIGLHYRCETDMDVHFLQNGATPPVRHLSDLVTPTSRPALIEAAALLFDPEGLLTRQALEHALELHCRFQGMYDRTFWKLAVRLASFLAGVPFRKQRHLFYPLTKMYQGRFGGGIAEWRHPVSGELQRTTLQQLAEAAVLRIIALFNHIESKGSIASALESNPGENLLTGMHGACLHEPGSGRQTKDS